MDKDQTGSEIAVTYAPKDGLSLQKLEDMLSDIRFQPLWRPEASKADDYYDGHQLTQERLGRMEQLGIPPLITNMIAPAINMMLGMEARTRTDWRVTQENEVQEAPEEMMDAMNAKLNEAERESRADRAISDAYASQAKTGLGWVEVSKSSDILSYPYRVASVHRDEIWWDWRAKQPDLSDARYLIRKRAFDQDVLMAMMPEHADLLKWAIEDKFRTWQWDTKQNIDTGLAYAAHLERVTNIDALEWRNADRRRATLFEVWYRTWKRGQVLKLPNGKVIAFNKKDERHVEVVQAGFIKPFEATFAETRQAIYMGCHRLYDFATPYSHRHFPYVPFWGYREGLSGVPYGLVRAMMSPQDVINSSDSKMHWMLNSRRLRADSDAIDTRYNTWQTVKENLARADSIVLLDPSKPQSRFKEDNESGLTSQQFQRRMQAASDINVAGGIYGAGQAKDSGVTSGVGLNTLMDQGNTATAEINDNYQYARRQVGELLFSLVRDDLMHDEIPVMVKKEGKKKLVTLNQRTPEGMLNKVGSVPVKVVLEDVPSTPAFRAQQLTLMTELTKSLPPEFQAAIIDMVIGLTDAPQKDKIIERLRKVAGIQPDMTPEEQLAQDEEAAQKQAEVDQAIQDRDTAETALIQAKVDQTNALTQKAEADKLMKMVEAIFVALQAGQVVATVPQVAPVADEILKGAGYKDVAGGQNPQIPQAQPGTMLQEIPQEAAMQPQQDAGMSAIDNGGMNPEAPQLSAGAQDGIETMRPDSVLGQ